MRITPLFLWFSLIVAGCTSDPAPLPNPLAGERAFEQALLDLAQFDAQHGAVFDGDHGPIHYLSWGEIGIPLLLLHGTYNTAHEFLPFAEEFQAAGYRPIAIDWYGHGKTPFPTAPVTVQDLAQDLRGLMDSLGIETAVIGGHSRGGMISTAFYEIYPDRTRSLILIDGGSTSLQNYFRSLGEAGLREWLSGAFDPETGRSIAPTYGSRRELFLAHWHELEPSDDPTLLLELLSQAAPDDDGRWARWRSSIRRWLEQDTLDNTMRGMHQPAQGPPFLASCTLQRPREIFRDLDVPVLVLDASGRSEDYRDPTPAEENRRLQRDHQDLIEHIEYPTGHYLHRERPRDFMRDVLAFLKRNES